MVVLGEQKFIGQVAHAGIHVDDVETCLHGAPCTGRLPTQQILDVGFVHHLRT